MRANRIHRFGPPEVIDYESVEDLVPGPEEVLVDVGATGVGPWDGWVRAGKSAVAQKLPLTLGSDLSGVVREIGPGVEAFRVGDEVFGVTNASFVGANAEQAVASTHRIAAKPRGLGHVEAAAAPVVAVTASEMLFQHARIAPGQVVLIHGAAGSVGSLAVQLARREGAEVLATALSRQVDYVRGLGATEVIDVEKTPFEQAAGRVDAVIDTLGGAVQQKSFSVLKPGGILVSSVSPPDPEEAHRLGVRASFFLVDVTTEELQRLARRLEAQELIVRVGAVLPLSDCRVAHEMLQGSRPRPSGKIVLRNA